MDNAGWHARRRAAQQDQGDLPPSRGPDGHYRSSVIQVEPMDDAFIGGWAVAAPGHPSSLPAQPEGNGNVSAQLGLPAQPSPAPSAHLLQTGYPFVLQTPPSHPGVIHGVSPSFDQSTLSRLGPVERSEALNLKKRTMHPYLQYMCGPLLRYDTIDEHGMWYGAALIVTADAGSTYEPFPTLKYCWDPKKPALHHRHPNAQVGDLGPHPADPMAQHYGQLVGDEQLEGPSVLEQRVVGTELYVYGGRGGTCTFWRFLIQIPLSDSEMKIQYSINDGLEMDFFVPARIQPMRVATHSCNGFSAGVNPDDFRGPGFQSGYDPLWVDLLAKHAEQPFHVLVGGGDQLYCDGVAREPEMQEWVSHKKQKEKMSYRLNQEMLDAIDRFYFNHYCRSFRSGAFARANSSIPMVNMLDDHDLIDGFGSYPDDLQRAPVFNTIGSRGYFFYLLFQCFINISKDGVDDRTHPFKSTIIGIRGDYIPYPSHSILTPLGPAVWLLMLDCRAERKLGQVCSKEEYGRVFKRMLALPQGIQHVIVQLGIPIAYPRMAFLETMLSSKFNPLVTLGRSGTLGLKGFVNKFNGDAELLDDLNDHWTSKHNMGERNWLIEQLQDFALSRQIRISFLSGDVHCASVGVLKTLTKGKRSTSIAPSSDHRYMLNVVTSAIVNTPPPNGVLTLVHSLSTKRHKELHHIDTDEEMIPLFDKNPDGSKPKSHYIMGKRNWCCITLKLPSNDLLFDIRVERVRGHGETFGYSVMAPPPRWVPKAAVK